MWCNCIVVSLAFLIVSVVANSSISSYQCANETTCDDDCEQLTHYLMETISHVWAKKHETVAGLYNSHGCNVAVEIGVARGSLTNFLLRNVPGITEYHTVDPFLGDYDKSDQFSEFLMKANKRSSSNWGYAVMHRLKEFGCKLRHHNGTSLDMSVHFPDNSVDCLFVDGDHTYDGVRTDLTAFDRVVKPGGLIVFDDYAPHLKKYFLGLKRAVQEYSRVNDIALTKINDVNNFYAIKPTDPGYKIKWDPKTDPKTGLFT